MVDVQVKLMFEVPQGMSYAGRTDFQHDQCFLNVIAQNILFKLLLLDKVQQLNFEFK